MYFSLKPHFTEGAFLLGLAALLKEAVETAEHGMGVGGYERRILLILLSLFVVC